MRKERGRGKWGCRGRVFRAPPGPRPRHHPPRARTHDGAHATTPTSPPSCSEGGFFNAILTFPPDYPQSPPSCRFTSQVWHPNVYKDGRVCISILHTAGDDPHGYEAASERWSPVHTVETIMVSIISMLSSPNDESPANVDAAKEWREDRDGFKKRVGRCVRRSQEDM